MKIEIIIPIFSLCFDQNFVSLRNLLVNIFEIIYNYNNMSQLDSILTCSRFDNNPYQGQLGSHFCQFSKRFTVET